LFKFKEGEDFNHRNILEPDLSACNAQAGVEIKGDVMQRSREVFLF